MKIVFNDATELTVQSADVMDDMLTIKTISATVEELKKKFQDSFAVKKMIIKERESVLATYDGYENLYSITEYTGGILGVVMRKKESIPEVQKEIQSAMVAIAQMQAQSLTDAQALDVQAIYPDWSGDGVAYTKDYKVQHDGVLYKCVQDHESQSDWAPGVAPSLWTAIASDSNTGTKDNPIPVPDTVTTAGMEYTRGKYYSYVGKTYLMNRQGMADGDSIILYFAPNALVGQYFEEV